MTEVFDRNGVEILVGDSIKVQGHSGSRTVKSIVYNSPLMAGVMVCWWSGGIPYFSDPLECEVILDDSRVFIKRLPI